MVLPLVMMIIFVFRQWSFGIGRRSCSFAVWSLISPYPINDPPETGEPAAAKERYERQLVDTDERFAPWSQGPSILPSNRRRYG